MSKYWRIYCTEPGDEGWKYEWSETPPTGCPTDPGHSINSNSVKQIGKEIPMLRILPNTYNVRSSSFYRTGVVHFDPSDYPGVLRRVKVLSYMDTGVTSYDVEVFDRDNNIQLVTSNFSNIKQESLQDIGVISTPPTTAVVLHINVKRTGERRKYARIKEIIFYFKSVNI